MYLCKRKTYEMKKKNSKIEMDQQTIRLMIDIYCKHHLGTAESPLKYNQLVAYACHLFEHCRWGEKKNACKDCSVRCHVPGKKRKNTSNHAVDLSKDDILFDTCRFEASDSLYG